MNENPRDTQFRGFAELVMRDLLASYGYKEAGDIIARRAYDLACHVATHTLVTAHGDMGKIPDLTEWPKENTNG